MPQFEDDDTPPTPISDDETDVEGDENGMPHRATTPAPPPTPPGRPMDPLPKRRGARRPNNVPPQNRAAAEIAAKQAADPTAPAVAISNDDRDVRVWWPKVLKEEFLDKSYPASDACIYVYRSRASGRATGEKPTYIQPTISGEEVAGHANQSPGDALVEYVTRIHHPEARGFASYIVRVRNLATYQYVGKQGTLDLEPIAEIEARQKRVENMRREQAYRVPGSSFSGFAPAYAPPRALPPAQIPQAPAPTPPTAPGSAASGNDVTSLIFNLFQQMWDEQRAAARENRQPVMPPIPVIARDTIPAPAGPVMTEDERIAKIVTATVAALKQSGILPAAASGGSPPPAPKDPLTLLYEQEAADEKKDELVKRWAKKRGFLAPDELPDVEVPAPAVVGAEKPEPREGQGMFSFMIERILADIAENPKKVFEFLGKAMSDPTIGGMIKDALARQGMLPSIPTTGAPSVNGAGGFIPSP